jgi:hypothetical protein
MAVNSGKGKFAMFRRVCLAVGVYGLGCVGMMCGNGMAQEFYSKDYSSPRDSAVPGEYYFHLGVDEIKRDDYRYAIMLYKIAASWAYKPAEYNLGVIFVKGEGGVPEDRPQGLAWLTLAAERDDKSYIATRDRVRAALTPDEVAKADALVADLSETYGDKHALPRAKARWRDVRNGATGSHVGFTGNMQVGSLNVPSSNNPLGEKGGHGKATAGANGGLQSSMAILGGSSTDGSIAYRQLRETDNPYDPRFNVGTVTVGAVEAVGKNTDGKEQNKAPPETDTH